MPPGTAIAFGWGALTSLLRAAGSAIPATALPPLQSLSTQESLFSASLSLPTALAVSSSPLPAQPMASSRGLDSPAAL